MALPKNFPGTGRHYIVGIQKLCVSKYREFVGDQIATLLNYLITIFVNVRLFRHFEIVTNIRTWIKSHKYWRML
jgi:hypothetical protein